MACHCENNPKRTFNTCGENTPSVIQIDSKECPVLFHTINIPASIGNIETMPPTPGAYRNTRVYYEADKKSYLYDSDGIPQVLASEAGEGAVKSVNGKTGDVVLTAQDIGATSYTELQDEIESRENGDINLQSQIDAITVSSDVADVVGTYANLENYDTSTLTDNAIIKVLSDETHGDAIYYYRWSTNTDSFSAIGSEGPFYTKSETDTLLNDKQDILTAGSNITISGDTISATDTTYSNFVGTDGVNAGVAGLVPAPATTDTDKFLKSDGTWDEAGGGTLYTTYGQNTDGAMTQKATTDLVYTSGDPTKINIGSNGATGGTNSIIIGSEDSGTITGAADQIIIGHNATDGGQADTIIIGHGSGPTGSTSGGSSISIGNVAKAYSNAVAIGHSSTALDTSVAIGQSSGSSTYIGVAIGYYAVPKGSSGIAIGRTANAGSNAIAIGNSVNTDGTTSTSSVAIGYNASTPKGSSQGYGDNKVAIGNHAYSRGQYAVSLGYNSAAGTNANNNTNTGQTALGHEATATGRSSVAIGEGSRAELQGEFNISATNSNGYNSTNYRLITGVHDGQNAHDAATVAQGNTLATSAPTTTTVGVLGQLYTDTTNMHTYQLTAIDTTDPDNPVYTWTQRW